MKKKVFYTEFAYIFGIVLLALSASLMEKADFGLSMVVAPAYLLHLKISQFLPFFSFGMAEYTLQAVILILMIAVIRKFKASYLFSFVTAVVYGFTLDLMMLCVASISCDTIFFRIILFLCGLLGCSVGVSLLFHTYIAPEVYELFVKEVAQKYSFDIHRVKSCYDITSCIISIILSFAFFGLWQFEGVKIGTIICAVTNGLLIGIISKLFEKSFDFKDGLKLRKYFE